MRPSYAEACARFDWRESLAALGWTPDGDVNLADTIVARHAGSGRDALRWFGRAGAERTLSFDALARLASRFAGFLAKAGVRKGDRVAGVLPRVPETLAIMLGTWKTGAVYVPIFTGFGGDAVAFRVRHSGATVLCTHQEYRDRVPALPPGTHIVTVGGGQPGDIAFDEAVAGQPEHGASVPCRRDDPAVLLYTSGSTGPPKGVKIATNFPLAVHPWVSLGLDLKPDDVFWPTGDPGWGYGLICYMGALALGVPVVAHEATPTADVALSRISALGVTNLATTPTLLRGVMALGESAVRARPARVRRASSCGEPLNAEVVGFFRSVWGVTVMDHYGSSEFGLVIGNLAAVDMPVKPGSMGLPFPGSRMAVVDDDGAEVAPGTVGQIAMAPGEIGYYSLGYWEDPERTRELSRSGWMTIGDLGRRDADGYFWFEGRADDVIKSAGYRIGPFEVESAILEHPAVAEAAVVGKPDALRGHIVKAFVVLRPGPVAAPSLTDEIVDLVKTRVGRHQVPREVEIVDELPKTETGKIQRFLLRDSRGKRGAMMATPRMVTAAGTTWPERYTFSPALRVGNLLFLAGTTAVDETGTLVSPGDIVGQTRFILQTFGKLLAAAGAGFEHVVETTEYITTTENYRATAAVRREFFRPPYPVATGVIVAGLLREGALIEISGVAVLPDHLTVGG